MEEIVGYLIGINHILSILLQVKNLGKFGEK
jgi:hypothetical protein